MTKRRVASCLRRSCRYDCETRSHRTADERETDGPHGYTRLEPGFRQAPRPFTIALGETVGILVEVCRARNKGVVQILVSGLSRSLPSLNSQNDCGAHRRTSRRLNL